MRQQLRFTGRHLDVINKIKQLKSEGRTIVDYVAESMRIRNELEKQFGSYEKILLAIGSDDISMNSDINEIEDVEEIAVADEVIKKRQEVIDAKNSNRTNVLSDFYDVFDN